jgi:ABC-type iron transport system FetAB ATPase subunit
VTWPFSRLARLDRKVDLLLAAVTSLIQEIRHMNAYTQAALDKLNQAVADETTVEQSVETLLTGLAAQIADLKNNQTDPAVLQAIDDAAALVTANNDKFKAAVLANTPAAPGQ